MGAKGIGGGRNTGRPELKLGAQTNQEGNRGKTEARAGKAGTRAGKRGQERGSGSKSEGAGAAEAERVRCEIIRTS